MKGETFTDAVKRELLVRADQAAAHGKIATAQWYRCWAETGAPIGEKPDESGRQCGPES